MRIEFRALTADDLPRVYEWLQRDHVKRWWYPEESYDAFAAEYLPSIEGLDPTDNYLIVVDGRPSGLIQTYLVADHPDYEALLHVGPGVAGVDVFLADAELLGRGVGPRVLCRFLDEIVFAAPETIACVAGVEPTNTRSLRAFQKVGFVPVRDYVEEGRTHVLLRTERYPRAALA